MSTTTVEKTNTEFAVDYSAAEDLIRDSVETNRPLTFEESQFLERRLGWDKKQQLREISRVNTVMRLQAEGGTAEQRDKAAKLLGKAKAKADAEEPRITEQINSLNAQRDQLTNEARRLEKLVGDSTSALERLKGVIPPHIVAKVAALHVVAGNTSGRLYHEMLGQIQHMEVLTQPKLQASEQMYFDLVERYNRSFVEFDIHKNNDVHIRPEHRGGGFRVNYRFSKDWNRHRKSLVADLPGLRKKLIKLEAAFNADKAAADKLLEMYWQ